MLDIDRKGYLTNADVGENLNKVLHLEKEQGVQVTRDDIYLIFRRYDLRGIGQLGYSDFCSLMMPQSKEYANLLNGRSEFYSTRHMPPEEYFNSETRNEIRNLFRQLIQNERATECLRVRIARR